MALGMNTPSTRPALRSTAQRRACGSIVINTAIALGLIVITLLGAELGYAFFLKREFQKTADLAALAGAKALKPDTTSCSDASSAASNNATLNLSGMVAVVTPVCGWWDPGTGTPPKHFTKQTGAEARNAVQVSVSGSGSLLPLLSDGAGREIKVEAIAVKDIPLAVFSVGSKLIDIRSEAPLISILKFVGADPSKTCLACYNTGLAGIKITPAGLLSALQIPFSADLTVGGFNALLAANQVSLGKILDAVVTLAGKDDLLAANVSLLNSLLDAGLQAKDLLVQLGTDPAQNQGARGLFASIEAPTTSSALDVEIDAFDLLSAALGVGTKGHAVTSNVTLNALGVKLETRIIEPASIGIGGVNTKAYNSQVRAFVEINSDGSILGGLLQALGTTIKLPIAIDVVNALGRLDVLNCDTTPPQATINVDAPILTACIGKLDPTALWSKADICATGLTDMPLVRILGADLLYGKAYLPALPSNSNVTLKVGETKTTGSNPLSIGDTLSSLLKLLLGGGLTGSPAVPADRATNAAIAAKMADYYLAKTNKVSTLRDLLEADHLTWSRPVLLVLSTTMPQEFEARVNTLCGGSLSGACARNELIKSLQTPNQDGLLSGLIKGLVELVTGVLGLDPDASGTPLLAAVLGPLIELLKPVLNSVGGLISSLLSNVLGLELGRTDVALQSMSCQNAKLVY
ncbi:TadG family pilus assembly protein [Variovorax sp. Root473]|uniref:TadG family pilus assembly protein n=1 Tax=Variovorax sp. Root473 TaxID=1736541 RepID=UPI0009EAA7DE|nr:TadG family pilus assembly protein [Variovorax sp. Root473]